MCTGVPVSALGGPPTCHTQTHLHLSSHGVPGQTASPSAWMHTTEISREISPPSTFGSQLLGNAVCPDKRPNFSIFTHFLEIVTLFVITCSQPVRIRFWFCPLYLLSPLLPPPRNSILFSFELTGSIPLMWTDSKIKRNQAFCSVLGEGEDQRVSRLERVWRHGCPTNRILEPQEWNDSPQVNRQQMAKPQDKDQKLLGVHPSPQPLTKKLRLRRDFLGRPYRQGDPEALKQEEWLKCKEPSKQSTKMEKGFPCGSGDKESACNAGDPALIPGWGRSPGEGNGVLTPVFLPEGSYGQRSLAGYSPVGLQRVRHDKALQRRQWGVSSSKGISSENWMLNICLFLSEFLGNNYQVWLPDRNI